MIKLSEREFLMLSAYIRESFGISLDKKQYLVENRLGEEFVKNGVSGFAEYWQRLHHDPTGKTELGLLDCLTTNYTYFYREEKHFEYLQHEVLPTMRRPIYLWCAGCATGQESYTLAMLLTHCQEIGALHSRFRIVASDISKAAVETAQRGIYRAEDCLRLPEAWKNQYCLVRSDGSYIIATRIRDAVRYMRQNLMDGKPGAEKFDIIFCRNVLIYFQTHERAAVVRNLANALKPGGYLFIGHSESLLGCDPGLTYIRPSIYRKPPEVTYAQA